MDLSMTESPLVPVFDKQDLRAHATEYNRDRTCAAKLAHGQNECGSDEGDAIALGQRQTVHRTRERHPIPAKSHYRKGGSRNSVRIRYRDNIASQSEAARDGVYATSSDESLEQENDAEHKALKGVAPDADITYSFDFSRGANATAREALPQALERAIERWETGVTEKLIKDEYEVVPPEALEVAKKSREEEVMDPSKEEEDGFELI